jgi:hypothetical protein
MPGVGSKEIDSPSNFRDDHHVDKVGYCDTTEDSMLPQGSSPLKARYTSSGYLKDLDAISIPSSKKSECPEGSKLVDGKCVPVGNTKKPPEDKPKGKTSTSQLEYKGKKSDLPKVPSKAEVPMLTNKTESKKNPRESITVKTPGRSMRKAYDIALEKGYRPADESFENYSARARKDKNYGKGRSVTITGEKLKKE